MVIYC
jgi:hypothetical protein